jgi:CubicO group peptidase (beta-lactamase class C family)
VTLDEDFGAITSVVVSRSGEIVTEEYRDGYLWWLRSVGGQRTFHMSGFGGNRVHVFPDLDLVAVITSENFARRDAHALSDRLLTERILPTHT